jgi:tRNA A-37 threonylcarbamoyl transferase component Bud32
VATRDHDDDPHGDSHSDLVLGRFRMIEPLGSGGHGTVWVARDERLRRNVALKRIPREFDDDNKDRRRIAREALAAARLSHPAIVAFYEALADGRAYYLVTELVPGPSLAELYAQKRLGDRELMRIGVALADALSHAHARGVVHRDVKPQNVIVAADSPGTGVPAKLADFGIAHIADEQPLTRAGDVIGTFAYMAPEQAEGKAATPASDLYALALTLYEGFGGDNPLRGATAAVTARRLGLVVPSLASVRGDLPIRLCAGIDRALSPEPAKRGTVADLREALTSTLAGKPARRGIFGGTRRHPDATPARHGAERDAPASSARRGEDHATDTRIPTASERRSAGTRAPQAFGRRAPSGLTPRAERLVAAIGAAVLSASALATVLGPHSRATDVFVSAVALLAVAIAPGAGWLLLAFGAVVWLALSGQAGTSVILCVAIAPVPLLLASDPWLWSVPALAPVLGALGVAAAFPGIAARAGGVSAWRRAALGAVGYWWVALTEELVGKRFLFGVAPGSQPRASWQASVPGAFSHALAPLCSPGRLAPALLWAAAALVLPWLLRETLLAARILAATAWAGGLILASVALAHHLGAPRPPLPLGAAALACLVALSFRQRRMRAPARASVA